MSQSRFDMVDQRQHHSSSTEQFDGSIERIGDFEILAIGAASEIDDASIEVQQAIGMVSEQLDGSIADATAALIARAVLEHRPLEVMADDVIDRRTVFPARSKRTIRASRTRHVEDWYAENHRQTEVSDEDEPLDADRWLYVHQDEVVGASSAAAVALISESGMTSHITRDDEDMSSQQEMDAGRISLLIGHDGNVQSARWG